MKPTPDKSPAASKRKLSKKMIIIASIAALLVLAAGVYAWAQTAQRENDLEVATDVTDVKGVAGKITAELPNGKTITYYDTAANKNISWWSSTKGSDYADVSHKAIGKFLAAADQASVAKLCGESGELAAKDDVVATISTKVRMIEYPTEQSCLEALATLRNTDATSRAEAAELVEQVKADVKQLYMTAVIK